jgi:segregation and condensation protein A
MSETVALSVSPLSVKTEVFEGPLELLLELVEKRKLLINDISLAAVTDDFIATVSAMQEASLPHTTQFVQLAATLLLIKSKSLLPVLELTEEEEGAIENLEERLRLYQVYRDAAKAITQCYGQQMLHERRFLKITDPRFLTDTYTTIPALTSAMEGILQNLPKVESKPKVQVRAVLSLEEMMLRLSARVEAAARITFRELLAGEAEPKTVIVGFLAVLESVKQGSILVVQTERFAEIEIERQRLSVPRYIESSEA